MANRVSNYRTLVSAVINTTEDDSAEFKAFIPTAIALAEDRIYRELDSQLLIVNTTVSATSSSRFVAKPSGYRMGHELVMKTSSGERKSLRKRTRSFCEDYWPFESSVAEPIYYADYNVSTFLLAPTPDANTHIVVTHEAKPAYLTSTTSVNTLTAFYPNALFYGTMSEMSKFAKQWDQVPLWDQNYAEAMQAANIEGKRARRDSQEPLSNPSQVNNTLTGEN